MIKVLGYNIAGLPKVLVVVTVSILMCSGGAYAQLTEKTVSQLNKPEPSYISESNPFDFAWQAAETPKLAVGNAQFQKSNAALSSAKSEIRAQSLIKRKTALQYRRKFSASRNGSQEQSKTLYNTLVQKYGAPKSVRGQSHVWDIKNPSRGGQQSDIITIIMKMAKNGDYELIMDRARGEDGRATWATPRIETLAVQKAPQQKKQIYPILQPDND